MHSTKCQTIHVQHGKAQLGRKRSHALNIEEFEKPWKKRDSALSNEEFEKPQKRSPSL